MINFETGYSIAFLPILVLVKGKQKINRSIYVRQYTEVETRAHNCAVLPDILAQFSGSEPDNTIQL